MDDQQEMDLIYGSMPCVTIYSDGGSRNNLDGTFGGYGSVMTCNGWTRFSYGGHPDATNNYEELSGVLASLRQLTVPCRVLIISDSKYVCDGIEKGWILNWANNGWKTSQGKPVQNVELWQELYAYTQYHIIHTQWVKGHAGNSGNQLCDHLATIGMFKTAHMTVPSNLIAPGRA